MKSKIILAAVLAIVGLSFAEEANPLMNKKYGVRAGTNWSSAKGFSRSVFGFQVGGTVEIPISQVFLGKKDFYIGANPEALFISKGGEYNRCISVFLCSGIEITTYYVEVPVPVSFGTYFGETKNFGVRLELGPYFAFGLFGSSNVDSYGNPFDNLSRFDAGIIYGAAIQFLGDFYFGIHQRNGFTGDNISTYGFTLGYNF